MGFEHLQNLVPIVHPGTNPPRMPRDDCISHWILSFSWPFVSWSLREREG